MIQLINYRRLQSPTQNTNNDVHYEHAVIHKLYIMIGSFIHKNLQLGQINYITQETLLG